MFSQPRLRGGRLARSSLNSVGCCTSFQDAVNATCAVAHLTTATLAIPAGVTALLALSYSGFVKFRLPFLGRRS
ncbi:MAG: hypothetical protein HQ461_05565 [Deltaproteobacteria bacterium]|nr:hypothetical protein [Deltaproteobacteria bacterium]